LLFGYASALFVFAQFAQDERWADIKLHAVYSGGEVLYPHQRKLIEETFGCKVFDRYGTLDAGGIACECEAHKGMHISVENCYVEVLQGGTPVKDNQPGEMVVTNLNNYGFPFIRYRLADVVQQRDQPCPCGRQSPMLDHVQGRVVDIFRTVDGRAVWGDLEDTVFEVGGIKQSQVIQKALDLVLIRIVKDKAFDDAQLAKIERVVKKIMGEATRVQFEFPDHIAPLESGKFRYAYSELAPSPPAELLEHASE
jgi:phenylacetate-CoA ligase